MRTVHANDDMGNNNTLAILYEDLDVLAINKPAGLIVHADGRTDEATVVDWIVAERPSVVGVGESMRLQGGEIIERPGIVHRLDRDTSGVLLIAKNQNTFVMLKSQFQKHEIEKHYRAFVYGFFNELTGTINKPIGRNIRDPRRWSSGRGTRKHVREAITKYTVLLQSKEKNKEAAYIDLEPKTGRTHQIRVHMHVVGHPVVADERYAPGRAPILGFTRHALHAHALTFTLSSGVLLTVEAPEPQDFETAKKLLC